ncbi:MAG: LacI family DNA-binding transcriptional regulator [Glaciecola sp.]
MSKTKLIDVANKAGVSKSTASQFLNGRFDYMSAKTKARIQEAIDELQYVPNSIARSLKTDKTKTLGVIVRDITGDYTSQAIRGMDDYCKQNGYNLIIYNTDFDPASERKAIASLRNLRVDGLIIASSGANNALVAELSSKIMPVVQFQLEHDKLDKDIIVSDYRQAAFDATQYLISLGHRRIAFVTQRYKEVHSRLERYLGYTEALAEHGISIDDSLVQYWDRENGLEVSAEHMLSIENPPTAFFTQHLAITVALMRSMQVHKVSMPEDVSLISFDEIPMAEFFKVPITVVQQNPYEIGMQAAKSMINKIINPDAQLAKVMVPCCLVKRDSCSILKS